MVFWEHVKYDRTREAHTGTHDIAWNNEHERVELTCKDDNGQTQRLVLPYTELLLQPGEQRPLRLPARYHHHEQEALREYLANAQNNPDAVPPATT